MAKVAAAALGRTPRSDQDKQQLVGIVQKAVKLLGSVILVVIELLDDASNLKPIPFSVTSITSRYRSCHHQDKNFRGMKRVVIDHKFVYRG